MLTHLYISNFTLIDELNISFFPGFSVITGETGAGKSIIIGATALLLGNRADTKQIKAGTKKCVVEATFKIDEDKCKSIAQLFQIYDLDYNEDECILRREVNDNGKSRAFINDTPVALATMKIFGEQLMDIHSQHQNLMLNKENFQLNILDIFADNKKAMEEYLIAFEEYKKARHQLEKLKENITNNNNNEDFLKFQQYELSSANLEIDEQERLEQQSEIMTHAEDIKSALYTAGNALNNEDDGILCKLHTATNALHSIEHVYTEAADINPRLYSCIIELKELSREISNSMESIDFDPNMLQEVNTRLDVIYTLENKYHVESVAELLEKLTDINDKLSYIENFDEELKKYESLVDKLKTECSKKADLLTSTRKKAADIVEKELSKRLIPLGIPNVRFKIDIQSYNDFGPKGRDKVIFLFSSNINSPMQNISQIASGGEISRVMLSLKAMMSHTIGMPTIIFDEIDTGVSGRVAEKMAHIMKEMGDNNRQVVCITHLPQIAAVGKHHYKVSKTDTKNGATSTMSLLSFENRITEIAQMLSGSDISKAALDNAKTLLITGMGKN